MRKGSHAYRGFDFYNPSDKRLYSIWFDMRRRCNEPQNKSYALYGGKGIKVCAEWNDFQVFHDWSKLNGYSDNLTIDRIDLNGNYEPSNCRWVDKFVQANNRSNNHYLTYKGETATMMEWSKKLGLNYYMLRGRIQRGMSVEDAFERPVGRWLNDNQ